jgi:hypothetical protein
VLLFLSNISNQYILSNSKINIKNVTYKSIYALLGESMCVYVEERTEEEAEEIKDFSLVQFKNRIKIANVYVNYIRNKVDVFLFSFKSKFE